MAEYPIIPVRADAALRIEQLGTKQKFWFQDPNLGLCLCKVARAGTGEHWSEKAACEIAGALGLPRASYELGVLNDRPCVVSPMFVPPGCSLVHGNELLRFGDASYGRGSRRFQETGHRLEAVWDVLTQFSCELPLNWDPPQGVRQAGEVFTGYLLLDALIGNTDRHHENWAVIEAPEEAAGRRHLAPTYDHAACLGFHLTAGDVHARLTTRDEGRTVEAYANRAKSAFFASPEARKPISTVDAFERAVRRWPDAASIWRGKLATLTEARLLTVLSRFGQAMPEAAQRFALRMLVHNKRDFWKAH